MLFVSGSWRKVSPVRFTIVFGTLWFQTTDCFHQPVPPIENDVVQCVINGQVFLKIDDCVRCSNENEDYDNILDEIDK